MEINISQLFEIAFGIKEINAYNIDINDSQEPTVFDYSGIQKIDQTNVDAKLSYLGTPILMPMTLKGKKYQVFDSFGNVVLQDYEDFVLPAATLVTMRRAKIINKTKANAANGTVKEMYGFNDWRIDIRGFCLADPSHKNATAAYDQKLKLWEYDNVVDSIEILGQLFNDLNISNIAIEEIQFNQLKGKPGVIPFYMKCVSDEPLELIL